MHGPQSGDARIDTMPAFIRRTRRIIGYTPGTRGPMRHPASRRPRVGCPRSTVPVSIVMTEPHDNGGPGPGELESTAELLDRARDGDTAAVELLSARYRSRLERWATGRLPRRARDLLDTDDLVQDVLIRTMRQAGGFSPRTMGGFTSYVRQALKNRIRDELRRVRRVPERVEIDDAYEDPGPTPLDEAIGRNQAERYEAALQRLRDADREAVVARIEMRCSYEEIADLLGKPSANAARMAVVRALERLVRAMSDAEAGT